MKKLLLFTAAILCLMACNQNAPTTYDKVAGHTYVSPNVLNIPDTLTFNSDGTVSNSRNWDYVYTQEKQLVIIDTHNGILYFESFDKRIINWEKKYYFDRID